MNTKPHLDGICNFFNSEGTFGGLILGVICSLEEERAGGAELPDEMFSGLKTGLMGPMAGIGDTIIWGTLRPIIIFDSSDFSAIRKYFRRTFSVPVFIYQLGTWLQYVQIRL